MEGKIGCTALCQRYARVYTAEKGGERYTVTEVREPARERHQWGVETVVAPSMMTDLSFLK